MKWTIFLVSLYSLVFRINSQSTDEIVYNKTIKLSSSKNEITLGQVSGLATTIRNPNQLFIYHRGSRQWNEE